MTTAPVRHVLGVVGSLRRGSFNRRLMAHAADIAPTRLKLDVATDLIRLPLFDEDLEENGLPEVVVAMQERIRTADAMLLATPEYNFGVPGPVKNFVDWASRPPGGGPLVGKPVAIIGASTGRVGGTVQAQGQLRITFAVLGAYVLPYPPILVAEAHNRFEEERLVDEATDRLLRMALDRFLEFVDALAPVAVTDE